MKRLWRGVVYTGVWSAPLILIGGAALLMQLHPKRAVSVQEWLLLVALAAVAVVYIWSTNAQRVKNGMDEEKLSVMDALDGLSRVHTEWDSDDGRRAHIYPKVNEDLLHEERVGYVFGRPVGDQRYVCCDMSKEGQRIGIFAGSGCGKTQQTLNFLVGTKNSIHSLVIDPKKENTKKVYRPGDNILIFDPECRANDGVHVGYNPFYMLSEHSTQQEIYECMNGIGIALISLDGGPNDFWKQSARDLLTGLFCYFYETGKHTVPDIVEAILSKPIQEVTEEVIKNADPYSTAYKICTRYHGMADETITSINSNLVIAITPYALDARLVWALKTCPIKFSPETLRESSVYVAVSLPCIESWASLVTLMVNQFITWGLSIPDHSDEPERAHIALVFEEFTAFLSQTGKIDKISQALRFIRSKSISVIIICQSISAIKSCYRNEDEVNDMLSNLGYLYFLDATEPSCQRWICDMCGTFKKKVVSWNDNGPQKNGSKTVTYQDEPIVRPQDLITLGGTDEAILISHTGGYSRIRKTPAWKEPGIRELLN